MTNYKYRDKALAEYGEVCDICDCTENIVVHHIDGDRENHKIENLIPLCRGCHSKIHCSKEIDGEVEEYRSKLPETTLVHGTPEYKLDWSDSEYDHKINFVGEIGPDWSIDVPAYIQRLSGLEGYKFRVQVELEILETATHIEKGSEE
jgi:hypothetical protein